MTSASESIFRGAVTVVPVIVKKVSVMRTMFSIAATTFFVNEKLS